MRFTLILLVFVLLSGCGTAGKSVIYTPPTIQGGRICTNQCQLVGDYCDAGCDQTYRQCVSRAQTQALSDYDKYAREQAAAKQPQDLVYGDFILLQPCNAAQKTCYSGCEGKFASCYTQCGGTKTITNSCQFLCF